MFRRNLFFVILLLSSSVRLLPCHGVALVNFNFNIGPTGVTINASSDWSTCGCGPYYLEVELACSATSFNGTAPACNAATWNTPLPNMWYHALLNVPNYNAANNWPDNCSTEPYNPVFIPFANLCPGQTYWFRARERVCGSNSLGPWTQTYSFTVPGTLIPPVLSVTSNTNTVCPPGCAQLMANVSAGSCPAGMWTFNWSHGLGTGQVVNACPTSNTTYTVTATPVCGTPLTGVITINVVPTPIAGTAISNTNTICSGQSVNLSLIGSVGNIQWQSAPNAGGPWSNIPGANNSNYTTPPLTGNTCYRAVVSGCGSVFSNVVCITVQPPITLNTSASPASICSGASSTLSAVPSSQPGGTFVWQPGNFNGQNYVVSPVVNTNYTVSYTSPAGCTGNAQIAVNILPSPNPNPNSNSPICAGGNLNLTSAPGGTLYQWTGPNGFNSNQQNPTITNAQPVNSGVYNVTITAPNGCTASANVNVVVNSTLNPIPNSNSPICAGNALNLSVSSALSYTWTGPNGFISNAQNPVINNAQPINSGNYNVTVSAAGGCTSSTVIAVTVHTNPIVAPVNNGPICSGVPLNINVNSSPTYTAYQWLGPNGFSSATASNTINNPNQNNSGNYTITITNAQGCSSTQVMAVTVYPLPVPSVVGATACVGQNTQLSASGGVGYAWTGPNGYTSNQQNPQFTNVQTNLSGVYTVVVTSPNNCTASTTATLSIISLPIPTASTSAVCQNQVLNLSAGGGASYQWFGPNGYTSNQQNPSIPNAQPNMSGIYTVVVTAASSCSAQTTVNATVNPLPAVNPSNNAPICTGVPLNLTVNSAVSYTWSGPNNFSSNQQNPTIANPNVTSSGIYTVSITDMNGCINSAVTNVSIHPLPVPSAVGASACVGQNTQLSASGGVGYAWTGPNGYTSNQQNPTFTNVHTNLTGVYTVVVSSPNNCTASTTASLDIIPLPVPTASTSAICQNQVLNLSAGGGVSYQWFGPNGYTSNQQNPSITNAQPNMSGTYTVIVTAATTCSDQTTVNATVHPLPNVTASNTGSVCELSSLTLNAGGAVTYTWSGPNNFSSNLASPTFTMALVSDSGTYVVIGTDANGCQNTAHTVVDVQPNPVLVVSGATVCTGHSATLSATTDTITSGVQWNGPNGYSSNSNTIVFSAVNLQQTGTYTVVAMGVNGCTTASQANLDTYPNPTISAAFSSPTVCLGGTVQAIGDGGYQYAWNGPNGLVTSSQKEFVFVADNLNYSGLYTLTIIGPPYGCQNTTVIPLTVYDLPRVMLMGNSQACAPFCSTLTVKPDFNSANIVQTWWTFNNLIGVVGDTASYCVNRPGSVPVSVEITDERGCRNIQHFQLIGHPSPIADFYWSPLEPREETEDVILTDASQGINLSSWTWLINDLNGEVKLTGNPKSYAFGQAGSYPVMLIVENGWGCKDTIVKIIKVVEDVVYYIPNAFTPNGDGINDTFGPKGYGKFDFTLRIFDRWGEKIFESRNLNDPWDGNFNGEPCKFDVYVWKMEVTLPGGKKEVKTGHVTLLR